MKHFQVRGFSDAGFLQPGLEERQKGRERGKAEGAVGLQSSTNSTATSPLEDAGHHQSSRVRDIEFNSLKSPRLINKVQISSPLPYSRTVALCVYTWSVYCMVLDVFCNVHGKTR